MKQPNVLSMPSGTKCLPLISRKRSLLSKELTQSPQAMEDISRPWSDSLAGRMWQNSENTWWLRFIQNYRDCHSRLFPSRNFFRSRTKMRLPKSTQPMSGRCSFPPTCSVRTLVESFPNFNQIGNFNRWGRSAEVKPEVVHDPSRRLMPNGATGGW